MTADLFDDVTSYGFQCRDCGWVGYVSAETPHRCDGFDLEREIRLFLNRWSWRTDDRAHVEKELRALIAAAKERA